MGDTVKEKYKLLFVEGIDAGANIICESDPMLSYHLWGYLLNQPIVFLTEDVLPEIDKALKGQPFDNDAGGTLSFLTINVPESSFSALNELYTDTFIPTKDLRDIIALWATWVTENKLQP